MLTRGRSVIVKSGAQDQAGEKEPEFNQFHTPPRITRGKKRGGRGRGRGAGKENLVNIISAADDGDFRDVETPISTPTKPLILNGAVADAAATSSSSLVPHSPSLGLILINERDQAANAENVQVSLSSSSPNLFNEADRVLFGQIYLISYYALLTGLFGASGRKGSDGQLVLQGVGPRANNENRLPEIIAIKAFSYTAFVTAHEERLVLGLATTQKTFGVQLQLPLGIKFGLRNNSKSTPTSPVILDRSAEVAAVNSSSSLVPHTPPLELSLVQGVDKAVNPDVNVSLSRSRQNLFNEADRALFIQLCGLVLFYQYSLLLQNSLRPSARKGFDSQLVLQGAGQRANNENRVPEIIALKALFSIKLPNLQIERQTLRVATAQTTFLVQLQLPLGIKFELRNNPIIHDFFRKILGVSKEATSHGQAPVLTKQNAEEKLLIKSAEEGNQKPKRAFDVRKARSVELKSKRSNERKEQNSKLSSLKHNVYFFIKECISTKEGRSGVSEQVFNASYERWLTYQGNDNSLLDLLKDSKAEQIFQVYSIADLKKFLFDFVSSPNVLIPQDVMSEAFQSEIVTSYYPSYRMLFEKSLFWADGVIEVLCRFANSRAIVTDLAEEKEKKKPANAIKLKVAPRKYRLPNEINDPFSAPAKAIAYPGFGLPISVNSATSAVDGTKVPTNNSIFSVILKRDGVAFPVADLLLPLSDGLLSKFLRDQYLSLMGSASRQVLPIIVWSLTHREAATVKLPKAKRDGSSIQKNAVLAITYPGYGMPLPITPVVSVEDCKDTEIPVVLSGTAVVLDVADTKFKLPKAIYDPFAGPKKEVLALTYPGYGLPEETSWLSSCITSGVAIIAMASIATILYCKVNNIPLEVVKAMIQELAFSSIEKIPTRNAAHKVFGEATQALVSSGYKVLEEIIR